jgi:hypothetical protein
MRDDLNWWDAVAGALHAIIDTMPHEQRDRAIAQLQMTAQVLWDRGQVQASYFCSAIAGDEIAPAPKPKPNLKIV